MLQLKEQLEMSGQSVNTNPVSDSERHDLENRIQQFLADPDPEVDINLDGEMRKINYVLKRLKKMINLGGAPTMSNGTTGNGNESNAERVKQFKISPDELIRLKEILEQRDTEIAVLVSQEAVEGIPLGIPRNIFANT